MDGSKMIRPQRDHTRTNEFVTDAYQALRNSAGSPFTHFR